MISNKVYDVLKWIVIVFLPALNTLIFALGNVLQFESSVICGIISAVTVFLGALIGVSSVRYSKEQEGKDEEA
jgi:hypothetical protein